LWQSWESANYSGISRYLFPDPWPFFLMDGLSTMLLKFHFVEHVRDG
jgi:hypothetical protein